MERVAAMAEPRSLGVEDAVVMAIEQTPRGRRQQVIYGRRWWRGDGVRGVDAVGKLIISPIPLKGNWPVPPSATYFLAGYIQPSGRLVGNVVPRCPFPAVHVDLGLTSLWCASCIDSLNGTIP